MCYYTKANVAWHRVTKVDDMQQPLCDSLVAMTCTDIATHTKCIQFPLLLGVGGHVAKQSFYPTVAKNLQGTTVQNLVI